MNANLNLGDLDSKGFIHIPNFLSLDEINLLKLDYENRSNNDNDNYPVKDIGPEAFAHMRKKFSWLPDEIEKKTNIHVDTLLSGAYFATELGLYFSWHQDYESYYLNQDRLNYLNLYLTIRKPNVEKTNLKIIPFDILKKNAPAFAEQRWGGGASILKKFEKTWFARTNDKGGFFSLTFDPEKIAVTPQFREGDLLIMRGDLIHRTEDSETNRVALSLRMISSKSRLSLKKLSRFDFTKLSLMYNNPVPYFHLFEMFEYSGKKEVSYGEYQKNFRELEARKKINAPSGEEKITKIKLFFKHAKAWLSTLSR